MILIAPHDRPQVYAPPLNGVEHPLAPQVVSALKKHGKQPVSFWRIINTLANQQSPTSRAHRRSWRLRFLCAIRELTRAGVLFRRGALIATTDFAIPAKPRRVSPSVEGLARGLLGSRANEASVVVTANGRQALDRQLFSAANANLRRTEVVESAPPTPAEISAAASALAKRPRRRKTWSGWIGSTGVSPDRTFARAASFRSAWFRPASLSSPVPFCRAWCAVARFRR
jgi:hypothetical protein